MIRMGYVPFLTGLYKPSYIDSIIHDKLTGVESATALKNQNKVIRSGIGNNHRKNTTQ